MTNIFEEEATTTRTARNIKKALSERLKTYVDYDKEELKKNVEEILKIHGMSKSNFDVVNFIETLISDKLNDVSIDDNSNKNSKTISGITSESTKAFDKAVGYDYLYRQMVEDHGKKEAKRLSGLMYDYTLAISDSSKLMIPYCFAIDTTKLVFEGRPFGQLRSKPPKRLTSYISALNETAHQLGSHLAGAIALSTLFIDVAYILLYREKMSIETIEKDPETRKYIENSFQSLIHSVNHLSRSGAESIFTNVSIFDKPKLENILADDNMWWVFMMGDMDYSREEIIKVIQILQDIYVDIMDKGDPSSNGMPYRFPVCTLNISKRDGQVIDRDFLDNVVNRDISRYNIFVSEGTKVASCCFDEGEKILWRSSNAGVHLTTFGDLVNYPRKEFDNPKVYHNGTWKSFKRVKVPYDMHYYKITLANGKTLITTYDHLHPTLQGDKCSNELCQEDYLMTSLLPVQAIPEQDLGLTYEEGVLIGAYLGDGSSSEYQINLSLNSKKIDDLSGIIDKVTTKYGAPVYSLGRESNNCIPMILSSKRLVEFLTTWAHVGTASEKGLNLNALLQSVEFRKGIIDGWYMTDGGNSNRIYTTSSYLVRDMECVFTSLGIPTNITLTDRTDEAVVIRGKEFNRNHPLYCLRWYTPNNRRSMPNVYTIKNNSMYFKIKEIALVAGSPEAYCVEVDSEEPYFTLPNGIITHNCRLINDSELMEIGAESNSFGGTQISLGSHRVLTINFNRLALMSKTEDQFMEMYKDLIQDSAKILKSHKNLLMKTEEAGLHEFISNGWIKMDRLFSTIGILGMYEADIIMKRKFNNNDRDYIEEWLKTLNSAIPTLAKEHGLIFNIEQIPAESMAPRLAKVDALLYGKENVPFELYSNQFIPLWEDATIYERMDADGRYNSMITGGGIVHFGLSDLTTPKQNKELIEHAIVSGCEHFALNGVYCKCVNDHTSFGKHNKCPVCGKEIKDRLTRVVGFMTPVSSFNQVRREWEFPKRVFSKVE